MLFIFHYGLNIFVCLFLLTRPSPLSYHSYIYSCSLSSWFSHSSQNNFFKFKFDSLSLHFTFFFCLSHTHTTCLQPSDVFSRLANTLEQRHNSFMWAKLCVVSFSPPQSSVSLCTISPQFLLAFQWEVISLHEPIYPPLFYSLSLFHPSIPGPITIPDVSLQRQMSFIWCLPYWCPWPSIWLCEWWGRACCLLLVLIPPACVAQNAWCPWCCALLQLVFTSQQKISSNCFSRNEIKSMGLNIIGHMYRSNWCEKVKCHSYFWLWAVLLMLVQLTKTDYKHYFSRRRSVSFINM